MHVDDDAGDGDSNGGDDGYAAFIDTPLLVRGRHCHLCQSTLNLCFAVNKALQSSCPPSEQRPALTGGIVTLHMTAAEYAPWQDVQYMTMTQSSIESQRRFELAGEIVTLHMTAAKYASWQDTRMHELTVQSSTEI